MRNSESQFDVSERARGIDRGLNLVRDGAGLNVDLVLVVFGDN